MKVTRSTNCVACFSHSKEKEKRQKKIEKDRKEPGGKTRRKTRKTGRREEGMIMARRWKRERKGKRSDFKIIKESHFYFYFFTFFFLLFSSK